MKKQLKKQKYTFNISLLKYKKYITKLNRLRMLGKNEHRQTVLLNHIAKLQDKLTFLFRSINRATAIAAVAGAVMLSTTTVNAQTFAGSRGCHVNIDGLGVEDFGNVQMVDVDGDGDLDIFTTTKAWNNSYNYYENTGSASNPAYAAPINNAFGFTPVTNSFLLLTFGDLDGDGDLDLITTGYGGTSALHINSGTATAPDFSTAGVLSPFGIGTDSGVKELVDIDGDGDLDFFISTGSNFIYYKNTGSSTAPAFTLQGNNPFSLSHITGNPFAFGDMDGDGDLDFFTTSQYDVFFYENTGTPTVPNFANPTPNTLTGFTLSGTLMGMDIVDYDNDGDWDIVSGRSGYYGQIGDFMYYENIGTNAAADFTFPNPKIVKPFSLNGSSQAATLGDLNGDGLIDILAESDGQGIQFYENTGTVTATDYHYLSIVNNPFGLTSMSGGYDSPTLVDIDNDGDLDLFRGSTYSTIITYNENTGTATAPAFGANQTDPFSLTQATASNIYSNLAFTDLDGDGDLDILMGTSTNDFYYYENTGTVTVPVFDAPITNPFNITPVVTTVSYIAEKPVFIDMDNDGDMDILTGRTGGDYYYFENTGTALAPDFSTAAVLNPFGFTVESLKGYASPNFADFDNDGDLDMLSTYRPVSYYENITIQAILVSSLSAQGQGGATAITTPNGTLQMEAAVLPANATDGSYTWSVASGTGSASIDAAGMLTALIDGTVTVTATANDASGQTGTAVITISNQGIGIQEDAVQQVEVFPNPTTGKVTFDTDIKIENIEIFNLTGELVSNYFNTNTIDISQLPNGIYLAKIIIGGSSPIVQKLIKE